MEGQIEGQMDGQMDSQIEGQMEGQVEDQMGVKPDSQYRVRCHSVLRASWTLTGTLKRDSAKTLALHTKIFQRRHLAFLGTITGFLRATKFDQREFILSLHCYTNCLINKQYKYSF